MSLTSEDNGLADGAELWTLRKQCERLSKELHSVKRHSGELKNMYDQSMRELKLCRDDQIISQQQLGQLKSELHGLQMHSSKLDADNNHYKQQLLDVQHSHHEALEELDRQRRQRDELAKYDSNEMLNKMYDTAVDRNNSLKNELEQLRRLYNEMVDENSSINKDNQRIKMAYDAKCDEQAKDRVELQSLRVQCTAAIHKWSSIYNDNLELDSRNKVLRQELDDLAKEIAGLNGKRDQELAILRREKDELLKDHKLVMSERENVLRELETLHEQLTDASKKISQQEQERKQLEEMVATYRQETDSALHDRDRARREMHELQEMVGHVLCHQKDTEGKMDAYLTSKQQGIKQQDSARQERIEVSEDRLNRSNRASCQSYDMKDCVADGHTSKEVELLRKEVTSLRKELAEANNDAGINKKRRDWAFSERDKIVQERESIRRQCDELRRERDRAVSNHAEVLRELDELKKFKQSTTRELILVREKLEKEERKNQLIGPSNSRDSAIDNDFQDWDTETLEYEIDVSGYDTDLGLEIVSGGGDASDSTLYINNILKGSPCEGRLRVNDVLLRVNDVDVANAAKETVLEAIHAASRTVTMRVRRKKPIGRFNVTVDLNLNRQDPGLQLETGVYISKIAPGSPFAKEGTVAVGDRVLSVNDKSVEHKTAKEVTKLIEGFHDYITLSISKYGAFMPDSSDILHQSLLDKAKMKSKIKNSDSEKNLNKAGSGDDSGGSTRKSKRGVQQGTKPLHQILSFFKMKARGNTGEDEESDTLKVRTENVMQMLDQINLEHGDGTGTWPIRSEAVEVSSNGTVTVRPRNSNRHAIPDSIVEPSKIYRPSIGSECGEPVASKDHRLSSPRHHETPRLKCEPPPDYNSMSSELSMRLPGSPDKTSSAIMRQQQLYEPKVQTLPNPAKTRPNYTPAEVSEKSKSLEGHARVGGRRTPEHMITYGQFYTSAVNPRAGSISSTATDSSAQSLDQAVKEYKIQQSAAQQRRRIPTQRPISLQPQAPNNRAISPNDISRQDLKAPSSPHRKTKASTPVNFDSSLPFGQYGGSRSASSQPGSAQSQSRSSSGQQMFFPSKPHQVIYPSYSPPPPYTEGVRVFSPPSRVMSEEKSAPYYGPTHDHNESPVFQNHTLDRRSVSRPSSTSEYSTARVKFPSNQSVSSNKRSVNSSSLEVVSSGRSSPLSPSTQDIYPTSDEVVYRRINKNTKLKEGHLRVIELDTSSRHLGISIDEAPGNGIFVASVTPSSLAAEVGLEVGDQIVEFCGINMRTATYADAARVLREWHTGDAKVLMKVQYNPNRRKDFPEQEVDRNSVTGSIQTIHTHMETPQSKRSLYPVHSNGSSTDESRLDPPRTLYIHKNTHDVGIRLCGGNATGVFVRGAACDSGLRVGDQIIEINGRNMQNATAEQAATELNRPADALTIVAQYNINQYNTIHTGGDHFYVKAHFTYDAEHEEELSISNGDLLLVENSLLYGQIGKWYVWKVDEKDNKIKAGVVPSRYKQDESMSALKRSFPDVTDGEDGKASKRTGSIGRRSFFKRRSGRHQHQRSSSRDSRELTSFSDLSTSSDHVPIADDGMPLLYQRMEKVECNLPRPVIVLGPFAEALIQKLVHESPDKFDQYEEELLNTSATDIEKGITDGVFVDFKKVNDLFKVTRTQALHNIAAKNRHSLLLVHPSAVDKMHRCNLYPIVVYIKHKTLKQVKEVKDPRFLPERLSSRTAKELFDYFQKVELDYKNVFTVEVNGSNMAAMSQNIKRAIDEEQSKKVWKPLAMMA